jgi:hypothetical protein
MGGFVLVVKQIACKIPFPLTILQNIRMPPLMLGDFALYFAPVRWFSHKTAKFLTTAYKSLLNWVVV